MPKRRRIIHKTSEVFPHSKQSLPYILSRSNVRKSLSIYIDEQGDVQVAVPARTTPEIIHQFIREKFNWIITSRQQAYQRQKQLSRKVYAHGETFLFLGKAFPLYVKRLDIKRTRIDFHGRHWDLTIAKDCPDEEKEIEKKLKSWYKLQGQEILGAKLFHFARVIDVTPQSVQIRNQKRLWGCCDWNKQSITLNWQIILAPMSVVDYVVIHELCHLIHPNHSARFWKKVEKYMPHYKQEQKWLKDHHVELMLPNSKLF